jgi:hypothetical protein
MTDRRLYALTFPEGIQTRAENTLRKAQQRQGVLGSDTGNVESIASEPGERPLTVEYPDEYARLRATELRELASGLSQPLPYYGTTASTPTDGYYSVSQVNRAGPVDPRSGKFQRVRVTVTKEGTPASHWRQVMTDPVQVDHPFGTTTEAEVGVPAAASKVRWFNAETGATEAPTVQATRTGEDGDVDILDATASSYDAPDLLYELAFAEEGITDPRVWDDQGNSSRTDANGALQWQKVFAASHRYEGKIVIDNDLLRVTIDEPADPGISAERYTSGSWSSVSLGASDWQVFDWDIRSVGTARVGGVAEFQDTTQSPTVYHTLRWRIDRGAEDVLWSSDSAVPSGLQTLLDPIAAPRILDAFGSIQATPTGLRSREEVV